MTESEIVERVKSAMAKAKYLRASTFHVDDAPGYEAETETTVALDEVVAHTAALAEAGFVIVPKEPTDSAVIAGSKELAAATMDATLRESYATIVWRAMIAAAPSLPASPE